MDHRIIDDRIEKYGACVVIFSKQDCRNGECLSRREIDTGGGLWVPPGRYNSQIVYRSGVKGEGGRVLVPNSSSLYTLFYSVIYNSVIWIQKMTFHFTSTRSKAIKSLMLIPVPRIRIPFKVDPDFQIRDDVGPGSLTFRIVCYLSLNSRVNLHRRQAKCKIEFFNLWGHRTYCAYFFKETT